MKRKSRGFFCVCKVSLIGLMMSLFLCACGKKEVNQDALHTDAKQPELVGGEQPVYMQDVLVAAGDMSIEDGTKITVELRMTEGVYFDAEHEVPSIYVYEENYKGSYILKTLDESGKVMWEFNLENLWNIDEAGEFNFSKDFVIQSKDYNGDGCPDFSLGQPVSSADYGYILLTVMPDGRIEKLCEETVLCCESKEFSVEFLQEEYTKNLLVKAWDNAIGEAREMVYLWDEERCLYKKSEESKDYMQASQYEGYMDEGPYEEWKEQFGNCDYDGDEKRDRVYREVTDTDIAYRIDFGNGDVLELAQSDDFFMSIKIEAADVCGFYGNEILFVGLHTGSTDPSAESDIYLYKNPIGKYERVLLPGQESEEDAYTGIETILSDRGDGLVKLECPDAEYEEIFDWEIWSQSAYSVEEFFDVSSVPGEPVVKSTAYDAAFVEYGGVSKLVLYQNVTGKWVIKDVSFLLNISEWEDLENRHDISVERLDHGRFEGMTVDELVTECYSGELPIGMEHVPAYIGTVKECIEEYSDNDLTYNLIYLDDDGTPELAVGMEGYWVSLYTYRDGVVYEVMDQWGYGAGGNHGYDYIPYENVVRNFNADYAGLVLYESYYRMGENYTLDEGFWLMQSYEDEEGNVLFDESDEDYDESNWHFYYEEQEITAAEYDSYCIEGEYEYIDTPMSAPELIKELYAPLFF